MEINGRNLPAFCKSVPNRPNIIQVPQGQWRKGSPSYCSFISSSYQSGSWVDYYAVYPVTILETQVEEKYYKNLKWTDFHIVIGG